VGGRNRGVSSVALYVKQKAVAGALSLLLREAGCPDTPARRGAAAAYEGLFGQQGQQGTEGGEVREALALESLRAAYHSCLGVKAKMDAHTLRKFATRHGICRGSAVDAAFCNKKALLRGLRREFAYGDFIDLLLELLPANAPPFKTLNKMCQSVNQP